MHNPISVNVTSYLQLSLYQMNLQHHNSFRNLSTHLENTHRKLACVSLTFFTITTIIVGFVIKFKKKIEICLVSNNEIQLTSY